MWVGSSSFVIVIQLIVLIERLFMSKEKITNNIWWFVPYDEMFSFIVQNQINVQYTTHSLLWVYTDDDVTTFSNVLFVVSSSLFKLRLLLVLHLRIIEQVISSKMHYKTNLITWNCEHNISREFFCIPELKLSISWVSSHQNISPASAHFDSNCQQL